VAQLVEALGYHCTEGLIAWGNDRPLIARSLQHETKLMKQLYFSAAPARENNLFTIR
jgi:hypothetical protein